MSNEYRVGNKMHNPLLGTRYSLLGTEKPEWRNW
jgi:hypothetical protein